METEKRWRRKRGKGTNCLKRQSNRNQLREEQMAGGTQNLQSRIQSETRKNNYSLRSKCSFSQVTCDQAGAGAAEPLTVCSAEHSSSGTREEMRVLQNQCLSVSNWALQRLDTVHLNSSASQSIFKRDAIALRFSGVQKCIHQCL